MYKKQKYRTIKGYRIKNKNVIKISNSNTTLYVIYKLDRIGTRHHRSVTSCRCCFSFVEFIINQKRKQKRQKEKKKRFITGFVPGTICSALLHLIITPPWIIAQFLRKVFHLIHASQMFLYNHFPLILKLLVQIASIFSAQYFSRRYASPRALS